MERTPFTTSDLDWFDAHGWTNVIKMVHYQRKLQVVDTSSVAQFFKIMESHGHTLGQITCGNCIFDACELAYYHLKFFNNIIL